MRKKASSYSPAKLVSAVIMIAALLWLTVSLPFVYKAQQSITWSEQQSQEDDPFSDTTEEKASSSGTTLSEEYLHDHHEVSAFITNKLSHDHRHAYDVYIAFHGELISPPPDHILS